jgi:hypothetical protein
MRSRTIGGIASLLIIGCAGPQAGRPPAGPAATTAAVPGRPPSVIARPATGGEGVFGALLAREASGLSRRPLKFGDRATAEIDAAGDPMVNREAEAWTVAIPIGTQIPVSCILYDKPIDAAASLMKLVAMAKQSAKDVTVESVLPSDAGVLGETAYVAATLMYTKPSPRGKLGGQLKMFARPDMDASLLCFHDEVGYVETFKRVAHGLAQSLKLAKASPAPQYVEIHVTKLGQLSVGFDRRTITTEPGGARLDQTTSCLLLPRTGQDLAANDRFAAERSDANGRVVSVDTVEAHGEELDSQYKLTRKGSGRDYSYKGKQSGKDVTGKFKSKEAKGLASSLLVAGRLRDELLSGKAAELKIEEYHPGISPQPFEVVYKRKGTDGREVTFHLGQLEATGHLDERGMVDKVSIPIAGMVMAQSRVFVRGNP